MIRKRFCLEMEERFVEFQDIEQHLVRENWEHIDFRSKEQELVQAVQQAVYSFAPIQRSHTKGNPIQLLDLFCGAGGTSLGFASLNKIIPAFDLLGGCDINAVSAKTYAHNYGTLPLCEDITELAYENGKLEALLDRIGYCKDKPTVLIGCAPCQGFSSHRKKHWCEEEDIRNSLVFAFAKIVEKICPDVIIMENVPEFLSKRYWNYFSAAKQHFERCGYIVKQNIYNAAAFGVPQERFRAILIGMKKEFLLPSGYLQRGEYKTVRDAIGTLVPVSAGVQALEDSMHRSAAHKESTLEVIRKVPKDGGNRPAGMGPACLEKTSGFSDVYGRLYWDRPAITITHYARNPASGRYIHPEQDRGLTAREAARLQSFPDGFIFQGNFDDMYRQIGEAVPPQLAAALAAHIFVEFMSVPPTKEQIANSPVSITEPVSSSFSSVIAGIKIKETLIQ